MLFRNHSYDQVNQTETGDCQSIGQSPKALRPWPLSILTPSFTVSALTQFIFLAAYSSAMLLVGIQIGKAQSSTQLGVKTYDSDSPIYNLVAPKVSKVQFKNPFWPSTNTSIFRQPPSDEVDEAWTRISNGRDIVITSDEVIRLGKNPKETVKADLEWGFGDDAHLGLIHAMHQNHCLNNLRKGIYYNYYYRLKRGFGANPPLDYRAKYYAHMDHCIEFLRLDIACKADLSISTYRWMEGESVPEADFSTWHQCRDFDQLIEWHGKHEINAGLTLAEQRTRWSDFKAKEGDIVVPQEPETNASFWHANDFEE